MWDLNPRPPDSQLDYGGRPNELYHYTNRLLVPSLILIYIFHSIILLP